MKSEFHRDEEENVELVSTKHLVSKSAALLATITLTFAVILCELLDLEEMRGDGIGLNSPWCLH